MRSFGTIFLLLLMFVLVGVALQEGILAADGGRPLPGPWVTADGGRPLPGPWLTADGGRPLPGPWIELAS
jgi:hypothetical protein